MYVFVIVHFWQVSHLGNHLTLLGFCNPNETRRLQRISQKRARKELPHIGGQGRRPRGGTQRPKSGAVAESARLRRRRSSQEELPQPEVRDCGLEEQPHVQGVVAARVQEGQEELLHIQGKEGRR